MAILLVRVFHRRLLFKSSQSPTAQLYIATEEPNLDEFGLSDDRVRKEPAVYAQRTLIDNPSFLIFGRRRQSI